MHGQFRFPYGMRQPVDHPLGQAGAVARVESLQQLQVLGGVAVGLKHFGIKTLQHIVMQDHDAGEYFHGFIDISVGAEVVAHVVDDGVIVVGPEVGGPEDMDGEMLADPSGCSGV